MSAQMITALRLRAMTLESHARALHDQGLSQEPDVNFRDGKWVPGRDVRFMLSLATEFRLLADAAESPAAAGSGESRDEVLRRFAPPGPAPGRNEMREALGPVPPSTAMLPHGGQP